MARIKKNNRRNDGLEAFGQKFKNANDRYLLLVGSNAAPVIAGLAVGVAFVVIFSILITSFREPTGATQSVIVVIPEGSSLVSSERNNFEPETITVVIGVNNTVTWINEDNVGVGIRAGDTTDPAFFNETEDSDMLGPNETFSFTFTKPGKFTYYSVPGPHRHGTIVVQLSTDNTIPTSAGLSQYEAIQIVENDFKSRQSDYDRINGIIVNNTSGYVRIEEFREKNLQLPLVYVHPNSTLIRINGGGQEHMGECNSGLFAYCGYLEPYNFDYKGRLVYGIEVLLWNQDNPPEAESGRGFPFLYIVDARTGEIVDSTFFREEWYRETQT